MDDRELDERLTKIEEAMNIIINNLLLKVNTEPQQPIQENNQPEENDLEEDDIEEDDIEEEDEETPKKIKPKEHKE